MEARLREAAAAGTPVLVVRAGDFFGPRAGNSWFSQGLVKPGQRPRSITLPGAPGVGHAWAYLPDVAETMVRLIEAGEPKDFATFHMEGHWDPDGMAMPNAIRAALGEPGLPLRRMPWWLLRLASPVVPFLRELAEMRYLWKQPVRLDNRRLVATLGAEPRTPLYRAVHETLGGLGGLPAEPVLEAA